MKPLKELKEVKREYTYIYIYIYILLKRIIILDSHVRNYLIIFNLDPKF